MSKYYIWSSDPHGAGQPWIKLIQQAQRDYPQATTIFGGDYIDSNKYAATTVKFVMNQVKNHHAYALIGNHEQLMYDAVEHDQTGLWFMNGAKHTIKSFFGRGYSKQVACQKLRSDSRYLFLINLPTMLQFGHLLFVHAGLTKDELSDPTFLPSNCQTMALDPNAQTHLWTRSDYLHQNDGITFSHNYTSFTIISGHTPTTFIKGVFNPSTAGALHQDAILPTYNVDAHPNDPQILNRPCPVRLVQYQGEAPRFFTDDGCHNSNQHHGNVCVFDQAGHLIKVYNNDQTNQAYYNSETNPVSIEQPIFNETTQQYEWK